jgi:hypothetical protein
LRSAALRRGRNNQGNVYGEYLTNAAFFAANIGDHFGKKLGETRFY